MVFPTLGENSEELRGKMQEALDKGYDVYVAEQRVGASAESISQWHKNIRHRERFIGIDVTIAGMTAPLSAQIMRHYYDGNEKVKILGPNVLKRH